MIFRKPQLVWAATSFFLLAIFCPQPVEAQDTEEEDLDFQREFEEEFELLQQDEEVVYSAALQEQKLGFSPSAVIVITRKDIEDSGAATLGELLRRWPAVHLMECDPFFPLVEVRTDYRVLLLVDGREANLELVFAPFLSLLPMGLQEIDRVEVVLGPNSAVYGANAVSAVINVFTRRPHPETHAEASLAMGEKGLLELDLGTGGGLGPVNFWLSAGRSQADSWMEQDQPAKEVWRAQAKAGLELGKVQLALDAGFSSASGRFFSTLGAMSAEDLWLLHSQALFRYRPFSFSSYWYGLRGRLDPGLILYYPALKADLGRIPTINVQGDRWQSEARFSLAPWRDNSLVLGVDSRYLFYRSEQLIIMEPEEIRLGAFFHDSQQVGERWLLQLGTRFDWSSRTDWALSPRGAVVWNPAGEHFLRLSGGVGFRSPALLESAINFKVEANPAFPEIKDLFEKYGTANPELRNELLSSIELGWKASWLENRLFTSLDLYAAFNRRLIEFRSEVVFAQTPLGPRLDLENSNIGFDDYNNDQNIFGAHITAKGVPARWLELFLRADLRHASFTERGGLRNPWHPFYVLAAGATVYLLPGWQGQAVFAAVSECTRDLSNPQSVLLPASRLRLEPIEYFMLYLGRDFEAGPLQLSLGASFFNPFGGRFREERGMIDQAGRNFGGQLLSRRFMLILKAGY